MHPLARMIKNADQPAAFLLAQPFHHFRHMLLRRFNSRRIMLIDRVEWKDGWPFVGTPSDDPRPAPLT